MDRRKGRMRKRPFFGACHVERRKNTSCGIHIYLEYKFVGAQRREMAFALELDWIQVATYICCVAVNGLRCRLRSYRASDVVPISL
jgi:hypothetical protein